MPEKTVTIPNTQIIGKKYSEIRTRIMTITKSIQKMFDAIKTPRKVKAMKFVGYQINLHRDGSFDFNLKDDENITLDKFGAYEGDTYTVEDRDGGIYFKKRQGITLITDDEPSLMNTVYNNKD